MMSYEQLRTYFTWRTGLRNGKVSKASISYAFVYVYELLNLIGVISAEEGYSKLVSFWEDYRAYSAGLDKHIPGWLKDYRVYYSLSETVSDNDALFDLYCAISNYDVKRSPFYTDENKKLIKDTVSHVLNALENTLSETERPLDSILFNPLLPGKTWQPFSQALFFPGPGQPDKKIILSHDEIYVCHKNEWIYRTAKQCNRKLMGYILKQTESLLRDLEGYKRRLSVSLRDLDNATLIALQTAGIKLDVFVMQTMQAFIAERNRIEVTVRQDSLNKIRQEALVIQDKLTVDMEKKIISPAPAAEIKTPTRGGNTWEDFLLLLSDVENKAINILLQNENINAFAAEHTIMPEVLINGINQKCVEIIGDTLIGDDGIYEEYRDLLMEVVQHEHP
jgi:hypothetical protein